MTDQAFAISVGRQDKAHPRKECCEENKMRHCDLGVTTGRGFNVVLIKYLFKEMAFELRSEQRENPPCQDHGGELFSLRSPGDSKHSVFKEHKEGQ